MAKQQPLAEPEGFDSLAGPQDGNFFDLPEAIAKQIEDPTMDPASDRWNPRKYFGAQPKVVVTILKDESDMLSDPNGKKRVVVPYSINGYVIEVVKGAPTRVPRDFAKLIIEQGHGYANEDMPV